MKKEIKISTEQAQQLYKEHPEWRDTLLSEFTDEELGIYKPFTWEDLKMVKGNFMDISSFIGHCSGAAVDKNKNIFPCEADAKKALAEAQLRQLAKYYNDGELEGEWVNWSDQSQLKYYAYCTHCAQIITSKCRTFFVPNIFFKRIEDLKKCIKDNRDLWYDYFKVPKKYRK